MPTQVSVLLAREGAVAVIRLQVAGDGRREHRHFARTKSACPAAAQVG